MNQTNTTLYIGGLDRSVDVDKVYAIFITFGEIVRVDIAPKLLDGRSSFVVYVQYESLNDAKAAIDNMHLAEIFGHTIKCNFSREAEIL